MKLKSLEVKGTAQEMELAFGEILSMLTDEKSREAALQTCITRTRIRVVELVNNNITS